MQENEVVNYIKKAFEYKEHECYKQAIEMLYKVLETESDNIEILFQIGELYVLLHNYNRAVQYLEKVLVIDAKHLPSLKLLLKVYLRQDELQDAKKLALSAYEIEKSPANLKSLVKILGELKDFDEIEKYKDDECMDSSCLYAWAEASYKSGKVKEAKELIEKACSLDNNNADCKVLLGKIYFDESEFDKSREIFESFGKNSQDADVLNYLGLFALEDTNFVEAIKFFSRASNIDKNNPVYFYNLGNAYFFNGWHEEAVNAYQKAICLKPDNADYRYSLAYLLFEDKEFDKAKKEVDIVLENNPKHYQARVLAALLKFENKDFLGAQKILEENIKDGSQDDFTLISLGKVYSELDIFEKAERVTSEVIDRNPDNLNYKSSLADIYIKEKKFDRALEIVKELLSANERYISGCILGAKAAYLKADMELAKKYAQDAISLDINCSEGYYYLALVRVSQKDYEEAIECMKRAITYDINNAKYYAEMSNIYKLKEDIKTAFEYIKEAESIDNSTEYKIMYRELAALNRKL